MENTSFLEWLRNTDTKSAKPKEYKSGTTLVSVKFLSPFNDEHFFQQLLMNHPHRSVSELKHPRFDVLPEPIRYFASTLHHMHEQWTIDDNIREHFRREGNRDYFVDTLMSHISSLRDTLHLWQRQLLKSNQFAIQSTSSNQTFQLDSIQSAILNKVIQSFRIRNDYYDINVVNDEESTDSDDEKICLRLQIQIFTIGENSHL